MVEKKEARPKNGKELWQRMLKLQAIQRGRPRGDPRCDHCPNLGFCDTVPWKCGWRDGKTKG